MLCIQRNRKTLQKRPLIIKHVLNGAPTVFIAVAVRKMQSEWIMQFAIMLVLYVWVCWSSYDLVRPTHADESNPLWVVVESQLLAGGARALHSTYGCFGRWVKVCCPISVNESSYVMRWMPAGLIAFFFLLEQWANAGHSWRGCFSFLNDSRLKSSRFFRHKTEPMSSA